MLESLRSKLKTGPNTSSRLMNLNLAGAHSATDLQYRSAPSCEHGLKVDENEVEHAILQNTFCVATCHIVPSRRLGFFQEGNYLSLPQSGRPQRRQHYAVLPNCTGCAKSNRLRPGPLERLEESMPDNACHRGMTKFQHRRLLCS